MPKRNVAVLGATGTVGQRIVSMLQHHPWYNLAEVAASEISAGQRYEDAVGDRWLLGGDIPESVRGMDVLPCDTGISSGLVFSALDAKCAGPIEDEFANAGHYVFSNTRNHRMDPYVPLLIPEVNPEHLQIIDKQKRESHRSGFIVTDPNCSTIGMVLALKPLDDAYGVKSVHVVTMQAITGAGLPGEAASRIHDNVKPLIPGEEEKIQIETQKILGSVTDDGFVYSDIAVSAQCNRVPVLDGHTECVFVTLRNKPNDIMSIIKTLRKYRGIPPQFNLPTAPDFPIKYTEKDDRPQPRLDRYNGDGRAAGMVVTVGRLRDDPVWDNGYRFVVLSHNTIRGAAGAAILNAELADAMGYIR